MPSHATRSDATPAALDDLARALAAGPGRLASPAIAGTLAFALRGGGRAPQALALLEALVPHVAAVAIALLEPLAYAAFAPSASPALRAARAVIVAAALERPIGATEIDVLREVALAAAQGGDGASSARLAERYAQACLALLPPAAPLRWPRRAAGASLRVVVLLPRDAEATEAAVALLARALARPSPCPGCCSPIRSARRSPARCRLLPPCVRCIGRMPNWRGRSPRTTPTSCSTSRDCRWAAGRCSRCVPPGVSSASCRRSQPTPRRSSTRSWRPIGSRCARCSGRRRCAVASARAHAGRPAARRALHASRRPSPVGRRGGPCRLRVVARRATAPCAHAAPRRHAAARGPARGGGRDAVAARARGGAGVRRCPRRSRPARERGWPPRRGARARGGGPGDAAAFDDALARSRGRRPRARRRGGAKAAYGQALALAPTDAEAHYNVGVAHLKAGETQEAARAWQRALAFDPGFADAHFNLGVLFQQAGRPDAAIGAYRAVLARDPRRAAAYRNLGEVLLAAGRVDDWLANFGRFEAHCPDALPLAVQALEVCQYAADFERLEHYLDGLRKERYRARDATELTDGLEQLLYLLLFFDVEPEMVFRVAQTYDRTAPQVYGAPLPRPAQRRPGKLRIGYLSADLRNHVMGKMMWQAIEHHDRGRFALHFYSLSRARDAWTEKFVGVADRFDVIAGPVRTRGGAAHRRRRPRPARRPVRPHQRRQARHPRAQARARAGHARRERGQRRALQRRLQAHRPATRTCPANQEWMIERLLRDGRLRLSVPARRPAATHPFHRAALGIPADAVVIGAFVTPMKLSRRCLALWREVLARVPRARLAFSPTHPGFRASTSGSRPPAGIAKDRLLFLPQGRDDAENQARYGLVDFVLDPMPFGGVNGVAGAARRRRPGGHAARQEARRAQRVHDPRQPRRHATVAQGGRDYVELAVRLAEDPAFMREVREAIRAGLAASPLVDRVAHTRAPRGCLRARAARGAPGCSRRRPRG